MKKSTKRVLLASAVSLFLCIAMLVGTTYAWFSDSVTSNGNIIKSGTLNIDLGIKTSADNDYVSVKENPTKKAFDYDLWEPGYLEWVNLKVSTTGDLALKYTLSIVANGQVSEGFADVIDVYTADEEVAATRALTGLTRLGTLREALNGTITLTGTIIPSTDTEAYYTIALKMQEDAGNDYQDKQIGTDFSIRILATQYTFEDDSIDDQYDDAAELPVISLATVDDQGAIAFTSAATPVDDATVNTTVEITDLDNVNEGDYLKLTVTTQDFESASTNTDFTVTNNDTAIAGIDLTLTDGSNNKVTFDNGTATITTYILPGLDEANIHVNYNGTGAAPTLVSYDSATGELVFTASHFSEYYVTYTGIWCYLPQTGRAYTDVVDAVVAFAADAISDDVDAMLNIGEIIDGYEYIGYTFNNEDSALCAYLLAGDWGFYDDGFLAFEGYQYAKEGVTLANLKTLHDAFVAAFDEAADSIEFYPAGEGPFVWSRPMGIEPFEAGW